MKTKKFKLKVSILTFIFGSALILFYTLTDHYIFYSQLKQINIDTNFQKLLERENFFKETVEEYSSILKEIKKTQTFNNYINNKTNTNHQKVQELFNYIISSNKSFMQIRYINEDGLEKIRFDREIENSDIVKKIDTLQDKSNRYYFTSSNNILDKVWFSPIDLNIEKGKVEKPFKPTFRVILPIHEQKQFKGILILNVFAKKYLDRFLDMPLFDSILTYEDSEILRHYDKNKDWNKYTNTFEVLEERYQQVLSYDSYKSKEFVMKKLNLPFEKKLVLFIEPSNLNIHTQKQVYKNRAIIVISLFTILMLGVSIIIYLLLSNLEKKDLKITILHKNKLQQNDMLKQKSKMAAMGEMIANIAHQWRQPLALISLNTTNLERKLKKNKITDEFLNDYIKKVNQTIANMSHTIEDFSNFFKPNKQKTTFNISEVIDESINILNKEFFTNEIFVQFNNKKSIVLNSFKNELLQVILNILSNSKDAIKLNNIENGKIDIDLIDSNEYITIKIFDNAGGIDDNIIDRIFEPYFTTKFKSDGTGIGLYMCKMIIEDSLNGSITLQNHNKGAVCTIILKKDNHES